MDTHWFVAYQWKKGRDNGFASIEISLTDDVFVPGNIRDYLVEEYKFENVVIINWKRLAENQLS